jgi:hypothetical protein
MITFGAERCIFFNEEPSHWRTVLSLHASSYSLSEPFVIPPLSQQATVTQDQPAHDQQVHSNTISELRKVAGSPATSSYSSVGTTPASSPSKSTCSHNVSTPYRHHIFILVGSHVFTSSPRPDSAIHQDYTPVTLLETPSEYMSSTTWTMRSKSLENPTLKLTLTSCLAPCPNRQSHQPKVIVKPTTIPHDLPLPQCLNLTTLPDHVSVLVDLFQVTRARQITSHVKMTLQTYMDSHCRICGVYQNWLTWLGGWSKQKRNGGSGQSEGKPKKKA